MLCLLAQWPAGKQRKTLIKKVISQRVKIAGHGALQGEQPCPSSSEGHKKKGVAQGTWTRNERMATRLTARVCTGLFKYLQRHRIGKQTVKGFVKMQSFEINWAS